MSIQDNITAQKAFGEAVDSGILDAFDDLVASTRSITTRLPGRVPARPVTAASSAKCAPPSPICISKSRT